MDEAANRCGLKGGTVAAQGEATAPQAEATAPQANTGTSQTAPAPAAPAAPAATPVVNLAPAGSPTFTIEVPGVGGVQLPDLYQIVQQFLAQFGIKI
ncbi:hypothetical protein CGBL_0101140 [Corynebacterium glutamicum]|nr:hypothetical protein CGBL_0101140 [Corynebacterium glutamicum]